MVDGTHHKAEVTIEIDLPQNILLQRHYIVNALKATTFEHDRFLDEKVFQSSSKHQVELAWLEQRIRSIHLIWRFGNQIEKRQIRL